MDKEPEETHQEVTDPDAKAQGEMPPEQRRAAVTEGDAASDDPGLAPYLEMVDREMGDATSGAGGGSPDG